ncbi:MAG: class I SAM-dependent methyltransferase [Planctomycetota bacterium]|jgi:predicted O-methyltransferase YrrM
MFDKLRRYRGDVAASLVVTAGAAGLGILLQWPPAAIVVATALIGLSFGYLVMAVRESTARNRLFVRDHGNTLLRQAEYAMELRRMLEPRAVLPASRRWAACPDLLAAVTDAIMDTRPTTVVECGAGLSTITSSLALEKFCGPGARMLTLEHDEAWAEESRRRIRRHGLEGVSRIVSAPLTSSDVGGRTLQWYDLTDVDLPERIDLLVVDGPPRESSDLARYPAGPILNDRLVSGAIIILDDAARPEERTAVDRWIRELGWERLPMVTDTEKGIAILRKP